MAFIQQDHGGVVFHTSDLLSHPQICHGFSTRLGGVSGGFHASLNFRGSGPEPDSMDNVRENFRRFCAPLGRIRRDWFSPFRSIRTPSPM